MNVEPAQAVSLSAESHTSPGKEMAARSVTH
jgi:hypothetical protein